MQDQIISLMKTGNYYPDALKGRHADSIKPWQLVEAIEAEELAAWYTQQQPVTALAALESTDPERHALLLRGKQAAEALETELRIYRTGPHGTSETERSACQTGPDCAETELNRIFDAHAADETARTAYDAFARNAVNAFLADGQGQRWQDDVSQIDYALLHNPETGEYLITMRDNRDSRNIVVNHKTLPGAGLDTETARQTARATWADDMTRLMRYAPITARPDVMAMEEADRLRAHWAASPDLPSRPHQRLFTFFPAFKRAYNGEEGFLRALNDVYGPEGNLKHCFVDHDVRHNHWTSDLYDNDGSVGEAYEIDTGNLLRLYEQMGDDDRRDFRAALNRFIAESAPHLLDHIEDKGDKGYKYARHVADGLAILKLAVDHGSGALAYNNGLALNLHNQMMTTITHDRLYLRLNALAAGLKPNQP